MSDEHKHFVYILKCKDTTYYTGYTTDVNRRLHVHESGKGAKYTRGRGPFSLVYEQSLPTKSAALRREKEIKGMTRQDKEAMMERWKCRHELKRADKFSERKSQ